MFLPLASFTLSFFLFPFQVTYSYKKKTIEGLQRTFSKALHGIEEEHEFTKFSRKNTLYIISSGAICRKDAHVANRTAFMFCVEKVWSHLLTE